jgi:hypothetical protein
VVDEPQSALPTDGPIAPQRILATALLALLAACPRERSASSAEELLPKAAQGALVTAPLAGMAQNASALLSRASQLPGGEQLGDWRRAVAAQLGFDPFSRDGQLAAGLDPDRGAALVLSPEARTAWIAALPLTRPEVFSQTVDRLLRERAAFAVRQDEAHGKVRVAVYSREGQRERVAFAVVRGYGVLARGDDPGAQIGAAAALPRESSLAQDERITAARQQLGAQDLTFVAPSGSVLIQLFSPRPLPGDLAVGLTGTAEGLSSKLFFQAAPEQAQRMKSSLPGGAGALVRFLPRDAPLVARLGLQPADTVREVRRIPELAELLARVGDDVSNDIAASLLPGAAFSIDLRPGANLAALVDFGFLDWHKRSPLETFQVVALAPVADRSRLERAFERAAKALTSIGAQATRASTGWQVRYPAGEGPRFGIRDLGGKPVAYLVGGGITPEQLGVATSRVPVLEQDQGASLQIDLGRLAARVRAFPESAYGSGPQAYVARSLISQIIEPLAPLRVSAAAIPRDEGLRAEIDVAIAPGKP